MEMEVVRLIDESGLGPQVSEALKHNLARAIRLKTVAAVDGPMAPGASRLGGLPDLPPGICWPGARLHFIAQISLAEVAPLDPEGLLPRHGLLSFFYNAEEHPYGEAPDDEAWRVLYIDAPLQTLRTAEAPDSLAEAQAFPACRLHLAPEVTLPPSDAIDVFSLRPRDRDLLWNLYEEVSEQYGGNFAVHRLLGHPTPIQADPVEELRELDPDGDWMLLLEVDSDENARMYWGDSGMIYYCIRRSDLLERRFDRVRVIFQCC